MPSVFLNGLQWQCHNIYFSIKIAPFSCFFVNIAGWKQGFNKGHSGFDSLLFYRTDEKNRAEKDGVFSGVQDFKVRDFWFC